MTEDIRMTFAGDPNVKIVGQAENVPVRWGDWEDAEIIGRATVRDDGKIDITIDHQIASKEIYDHLRVGLSDGLSLTHTEIEPDEPHKKEN